MPVTFLQMWHLSKKALDPLLGSCWRSGEGDRSPCQAEATKAEMNQGES